MLEYKLYYLYANLDLIPVSISHSLVFQVRDEGHRPLECVHPTLTHFYYLPVLILPAESIHLVYSTTTQEYIRRWYI